jgi:hypothetical protein
MNDTSQNTTHAAMTTIGTGTSYIISTTTAGAVHTVQGTSQGPISTKTMKNIESAVYSHIQAVRALGRTRTDTSEIARALGLTQSTVEKTISSLTQRGVRVING